MTTLKVHKHAVDLYFNADEQLPRQPNEGLACMDIYISVKVGLVLFYRSNGSTDLSSWQKWEHSLNL